MGFPTSPVLTLPERLDSYFIFCDTSRVIIGCVSMERGKVINYASKHFEVHKRDFPTQDFEFAAIVFSLRI